MIRKLMFAALAGASVLAATPALAVVNFDQDINADLADGTATFGNSISGAGTTTSDRYFFTLSGMATITTSQVSSINNPLTPPYDADFDFGTVGIYTSSGTLVQNFTVLMPNDPVKMQITSLTLGAGSYYIGVTGGVTSPATNGGYGGNINVVGGAVPEPATWGMMLLGFGLIGAASRRTRKVTTVLA